MGFVPASQIFLVSSASQIITVGSASQINVVGLVIRSTSQDIHGRMRVDLLVRSWLVISASNSAGPVGHFMLGGSVIHSRSDRIIAGGHSMCNPHLINVSLVGGFHRSDGLLFNKQWSA